MTDSHEQEMKSVKTRLSWQLNVAKTCCPDIAQLIHAHFGQYLEPFGIQVTTLDEVYDFLLANKLDPEAVLADLQQKARVSSEVPS